ncbi:MAG: hypothetical protein JSS89_13215 [Bacteroidetes bacterium]|nr:hypothetical protein [Bacteroidota bacterium]
MKSKEELVAALRKKNQELIETGGRSWSLRVPANDDDPDLLIEEACKMLEDATVWIPRDERLPTIEDVGGNERGCVNVKYVDGSFAFIHWNEVALWKLITHWSPIKRKQEATM